MDGARDTHRMMRFSVSPVAGPGRIWVGWGVAALSFVVRLGVALARGSLEHPELNEYDSLARAIVAGQGFVYWHIGVPYYGYAPPLHAWLGAGSYWVSGSVAPLVLLQCLAGGALAAATAAIAWRLFDNWKAAAIAGLLVAFHPGLVIYAATKSHPLTFDALFFTLTLLQVMRLVEQATLRRAVVLGAVVGIGTLSRATNVIFLPMAALWLLLVTPRESRWVALRNMCVAGALAAAIVAPWTIRTSLRVNQFVFLLTTDSDDFWRGNNPYASGNSHVDATRLVLTSLPPDELADLQRQPDELAQARWFSERARAFIRENPGRFVELTLMKLFHFWWMAPQTGIYYPRWWLFAYQSYYAVTLLLAAAGVSIAIRRGAPPAHFALVIGLFIAALSILQSFYYVEGRHRWAVEPMLLALSGGGAAAIGSRLRGPDGKA